ncbi:MAG: head-tail adaptor protein [Sphingomonas taxi]|uniref:Head-tail adaptor protein n=1 Tax=Sphingomonas taxi TaxID=1549858 RepID=A0A2W5B1B8_9SPHN|nr:MAG: head-tail adaptor protein [Sphingomonas taxi]
MKLDARKLDRRILIQRPIPDESFDGAGSGQWGDIDAVWASVEDALPSRGERLADGINVASRPARVRMRYRDDVTAAMRFVLLRKVGEVWEPSGRIMQIIAGPAELGRRDGLEFMVEEYSLAGNGA